MFKRKKIEKLKTSKRLEGRLKRKGSLCKLCEIGAVGRRRTKKKQILKKNK